MDNTVVTWLGVDISKMSRDELEVAFRQLGKAYQDDIIINENHRKSSVDEMYGLATRRLHG